MTIITVNCIAISLVIIYLHFTGKLTTAKAALLAFATQAFNIEAAGASITTLFCVTAYFIIKDIAEITLRKQDSYITKKGLIIAVVPIAAFFISENYYSFTQGMLRSTNGPFEYVSIAIYYAKNYLFYLFVIARKVSYESSDTIEDLLNFCEKIALYSCCFALFQIIINVFLSEGSQLSLFFGNKPSFAYQILNLAYVRPSGLFIEPKEFAGFLCFMLPYVLHKNKKWEAFLFILIGILTVSTTFYVISLLSLVYFTFFKYYENLRIKIFLSILAILLFALLISRSAEYLVDAVGGTQEKILYQLVTNRLVERVENKFAGEDERKDFYGIPLQTDLELPVVNFMRDYPIVSILGYGIGNANYVPIDYYKGTWVYQTKLEGSFLGHMNMGWLKYCSELGILSFTILFILITRCKLNTFNNKYYFFAIAALFFYRTDIIIAILYGVINNRQSNN